MEQGYITASEPVQGTVLSMLKIIKLAAPYSTKHIHTVSKKYTTQPPAIILTAVADSSNFGTNITEKICDRKVVYFPTSSV